MLFRMSCGTLILAPLIAVISVHSFSPLVDNLFRPIDQAVFPFPVRLHPHGLRILMIEVPSYDIYSENYHWVSLLSVCHANNVKG